MFHVLQRLYVRQEHFYFLQIKILLLGSSLINGWRRVVMAHDMLTEKNFRDVSSIYSYFNLNY